MAYLTIEEVESVVTSYFRRRPQELHRRTRLEPLAWIRGIVMALAMEYTAVSETECGGYFSLDRGSVYAARKRIRNRSDTCERDRRDVQQCRTHLDFLCRQTTQPSQADLMQAWLVLEGGAIDQEPKQITA